MVLVSKGGVSSDFDALLFMPVEEGLLLQVGVRFKLVDCGFSFSYFEEGFELFFGEVGDTDVFDFACVDEFFHGCPGLKCQHTPVFGGSTSATVVCLSMRTLPSSSFGNCPFPGWNARGQWIRYLSSVISSHDEGVIQVNVLQLKILESGFKTL